MVQLLKSFAAFAALTSGVSLAKTDLANSQNRLPAAGSSSPFLMPAVQSQFEFPSVPLHARRIQQQMSTTGPDQPSSSNPLTTSTKPEIVISENPSTSTTTSLSSTSSTYGASITTTALATTSFNPPITDEPTAQGPDSQCQDKLIAAGVGGAAAGACAVGLAVYGVKKYRERQSHEDPLEVQKSVDELNNTFTIQRRLTAQKEIDEVLSKEDCETKRNPPSVASI